MKYNIRILILYLFRSTLPTLSPLAEGFPVRGVYPTVQVHYRRAKITKQKKCKIKLLGVSLEQTKLGSCQ